MTTTADPPSASSAAQFHVRHSAAPADDAVRTAALTAPAFGTVFTDHMARMSWDDQAGWHDRRVEPYAPLTVAPSAAVLHYGQEVFEGLKAYRHPDGTVWAFRPEVNAARFARSARRLALPELAPEDFLGSIEALVRTDLGWVPDGDGASLYLRPFMVATESLLTVRPAGEVEYLVIASPAGSYFGPDVDAVSIWVADGVHRAGPGGTGAAKSGNNYGAGLQAQQDAVAHGCDQVCFLDAVTGTELEELGAMNVFVVHRDGSVSTPPLGGTILDGVTRASAIALLRDAGHPVHERPVRLTELCSGIEQGTVREVFACGTGAVVTPVGRFASTAFDLTVADGGPGPVATALREELTGIQYGRLPDTRGWLRRLD